MSNKIAQNYKGVKIDRNGNIKPVNKNVEKKYIDWCNDEVDFKKKCIHG